MTDPLKAKALCHLKYIDAIAASGGAPIIVPPCADRAILETALAALDGFCLIGGPDYLPSHYGQGPHAKAELMHSRRDTFDLMLAEMLLERTRKPVLGICGGHQLLNIAAGGALIQDLRSEWKSHAKGAHTLPHSDGERKGSGKGNSFRHPVKLKPHSLIAHIVGKPRVSTNSFHHQAVHPERLGDGFVPTAWSADGVIEAIEQANGKRFVLGVQWHPERQTDAREHRAIFERLVAAAKS
ncbi:MAG TPA: gamma-glutamyl-gamma-aminobutyrate hydrolase family protein [Planctomycetota bacterium]|nr:gamma-glutamyl-gamma-aminobutyrate hydrolase family protein [Planctomycetota bacterium]